MAENAEVISQPESPEMFGSRHSEILTRCIWRIHSGASEDSESNKCHWPRSRQSGSNRHSARCARSTWGAAARLRLLSHGWREILPGDQVRELATQSLDKFSLRAADSLQLAASLIWCEQRPSRRSFICGGHRLAEAASSAGFSVLELPRSVL